MTRQDRIAQVQGNCPFILSRSMVHRLRLSRRAAAVCSAVLLVLVAVAALSAPKVAAVDDARCQNAMKLQTDPTITSFKQCAGANPIPPNCCIRMAPFIQYADCLQVPKYKQMADSFLAPNVTVDRALKDCLGG
ncbi:hypothetical protein Agub_g8890 [Astrephomene gubernaculifera]|uniref:Uncharacterized protein n=1 Tax=Astrephomene gubernaculifera TaxID=47775 RepID=A0AAD3HNW2_9CHLO|nr:hypothetical protein Agub_g8890 [Astrephomene gubernaculifera]